MDVSLLEELKEKLNLQRLDNTILFTIPFTLFLTSALATWLPDFMSRTFGLATEMIQISMFFIFLLMFWGIISYLASYFKDDLAGRLEALNPYLLLVYFVMVFSSVYTVNWLNIELRKFLYTNESLESVVTAYNVVVLSLVGGIVTVLIVLNLFWSSIDTWCRASIPRKYDELSRQKKEPFGSWTTKTLAKTNQIQLRWLYSIILLGEILLMSSSGLNRILQGHIELEPGQKWGNLAELVILIILVILFTRIVWPRPMSISRWLRNQKRRSG